MTVIQVLKPNAVVRAIIQLKPKDCGASHQHPETHSMSTSHCTRETQPIRTSPSSCETQRKIAK